MNGTGRRAGSLADDQGPFRMDDRDHSAPMPSLCHYDGHYCGRVGKPSFSPKQARDSDGQRRSDRPQRSMPGTATSTVNPCRGRRSRPPRHLLLSCPDDRPCLSPIRLPKTGPRVSPAGWKKVQVRPRWMLVCVQRCSYQDSPLWIGSAPPLPQVDLRRTRYCWEVKRPARLVSEDSIRRHGGRQMDRDRWGRERKANG